MTEIPLLVSSATNTLTVQDVILDSPVWRANIAHIEDQIEQFEKWVDGFVRALKSYLDAIQKYNAQANILCKRTFITGLDDSLIDTAGSLVQKFATCLQSTVAYRMKMASDLEDMLLNPLSAVMKNELKDFKESRKQFERILEKYENQLSRYSILSKQKESSALREDAFQLYDIQKLYVRHSGDYFVKLMSFKSNLENLLVQCFTGALGAYVEEVDESGAMCRQIQDSLPGWKQWLEESKLTFDYQIQHIKKKCIQLEDMYVEQIHPPRALKCYSTASNDKMMAVTTDDNDDEEEPDSYSVAVKSNKQGYLYAKVLAGRNARGNWMRKWFFLEQGIFGSCTVSTVNKERGCIVLADRISISECTYKISTDTDRRYCFEVIHPKCSYYLQAETEKEMQQWLWTIEYCKSNELTESTEASHVHLSPKTLLTDRFQSAIDTQHCLVAGSTSPLPSPIDQVLSPIVSTASSLTSLMIREGVPGIDKMGDEVSIKEQYSGNSVPSSWGMPWLATSIHALSSSSSNPGSSDESENAVEKPNALQLVVWPNKIEMDVHRPNLLNYTSSLEAKQRELRKIFANVPTSEVVLESFRASLYREPSHEEMAKNQSFGYSGTIYVTQENVWFYSCTLMACVNMIIIPLKSIKAVRLEESGYSPGKMISIETKGSKKQFNFGVWFGHAKLIAERLKVMTEYSEKPTSLQQVYNTIHSMTMEKMPSKSKTPTQQVTTSRTLFTTLTPITVQAANNSDRMYNSNASSGNSVVTDMTENRQPVDDQVSGRASPAQGALNAAYQAALSKRRSAPVMRVSLSPETQPPTEAWPGDVPKPSGAVACGCLDHLDKVEADMTLPISAKELFELMFIKTKLWCELNKNKKYGEPSFTEWEKNSRGQKERIVTYMMPVSMPMVKEKETNVIDTQEIMTENEYTCYIVSVSTKAPNLSYADAFIPSIKYCITYISPSSCRLVASLGVKWLRSIMIKGIVNRAAVKGMAETVTGVVSILQQEMSLNKKETHTVPKSKEPHATADDAKTESAQGKTSSWSTLAMVFICFLMAMYQISIQLKYQSLYNGSSIVWRGVYLRDVEEHVLHKDITLGYINPSLYEQFQKARMNATEWNHNWTSKKHRAMATELIYSRERLGALRYELLSVFRIMNRVEYQLTENEYWNWVSDKKIQCDALEADEFCDKITKEINQE